MNKTFKVIVVFLFILSVGFVSISSTNNNSVVAQEVDGYGNAPIMVETPAIVTIEEQGVNVISEPVEQPVETIHIIEDAETVVNLIEKGYTGTCTQGSQIVVENGVIISC